MWQPAPYPMWIWLPMQLAGLSFAACGAVLWWRRPRNGTGRLMVAVGVTWYLGDLQLARDAVLFAVGFCLYYSSSAVLAHLVLALPTGRLENRAERWLVGLTYLAPILEIPRYAVEYPPKPQGWGDPQAPRSVLAPIGSGIALTLTLLTVALVIRRWSRAGRPVRREYTVVWTTILALGAVGVIHPLATVFDAPAGVQQYLLLAHGLGLMVIPVAVAVGLLRVQLARLRVAELVLRLDTAVEPDRVREAIAEALDDPSLELWFPRPHDGEYEYCDGRAGEVHRDRRALTVVRRRGEPLAVVAHDPSLREREPLVDSVVAVAGLALDNARLLAAEQESRARVVIATDAERRRLQRDLHDGVQHKLLATGMLVDRIRRQSDSDQLRAAAAQLREVIGELRELAEGIHPPALSEQGLAAAVEVLAERAPLPVDVDVPPDRWPEHLERCGYFVVAEALSNVYKHAGASRATVRATAHSGFLALEVADDGTGGADPARGTGLRGLEDRIRALGGRLRVASPVGLGTHLVAELPCES